MPPPPPRLSFWASPWVCSICLWDHTPVRTDFVKYSFREGATVTVVLCPFMFSSIGWGLRLGWCLCSERFPSEQRRFVRIEEICLNRGDLSKQRRFVQIGEICPNRGDLFKQRRFVNIPYLNINLHKIQWIFRNIVDIPQNQWIFSRISLLTKVGFDCILTIYLQVSVRSIQ